MKIWKKHFSLLCAAILFSSVLASPKVAYGQSDVKTLFGEVILEETESGPMIEEDDLILYSDYTGKRDWKWPVPASDRLSACYLDGRSHYALDIAAPKGTDIYASYAGEVIGTSMACSHNYAKNSSCGCNGGMGNYVYIRHNYDGTSFVSRYIHLTKVKVSVGDRVTKDTVIGTVGSTGYSFGFHLDFRIYQGSVQSSSKSTCVDPLKDQFLEMPAGINANAATTECCYTYVKEVKQIYAVPLDKEDVKPPVNTGETPFYDVSGTSWYHDAVKYVYEHKIMTGTTADTFQPSKTITRSQFVTMLYRLENSPTVVYEDCFSDVKAGKWYSDAIIWANDTGIVNGYADSNLFGIDDPIVREQITVMLYRYASYKGYDVEKTIEYDKFLDSNEVSGFAKQAISWAVASEFITGKTEDTLAPRGEASRAECATVFMRFMEKGIK